MSQRELAVRASVSTGLIGIVERGHWTLGVDVLAKIAEALGTTAVRLLSSAARMRDEQRMD